MPHYLPKGSAEVNRPQAVSGCSRELFSMASRLHRNTQKGTGQ